jgi:hypothetical protein
MSITIDGVPDHLTREQYVAIFSAVGFDPNEVIELRAAPDGVHALVFAQHPDGRRILASDRSGYAKHRVFIPVRDDDADTRTTRITDVAL